MTTGRTWFFPNGQSGIAAISIAPTTRITFGGSGIAVNAVTGEVTIPEGLALSDASRLFWLDLKRAFPGLFPKQEN